MTEEHRFEAEVDAVLRLVIDSLYSNKDVFLRELVSNASDALDKLRFRALTEPGLLPEGTTLAIRIEPDAATKTLTIADNGVGMTREELQRNLGTIARSGTREFLAKLEAAKKADLQQIGQFGVGFYSAFLVADRVEVVSRAAGVRDAWKWSSDGRGTFRIEPASRAEQGTSVVLHLKEDRLELLKTWEIERLVREYSDYLAWPIELKVEREKSDDPTYRRINHGTALWQRSPKEVSREQYEELYKHLSHDWEAPLAYKHFKVEGTTEFAGVVFIPRRAPFDLFSPDAKHGLRLHVKRVFVMEDAEEILPRWLRFVRGVVDSEDLPLNVSREILQDSRLTKTIRHQVVKAVLDLLAELTRDRAEDYVLFWKTFGAVLKEGLHYAHVDGDKDVVKKLIPLLRYETTASETPVALADVKSRMKEGQKALYYALGETRAQIASSPHIEGLRRRGIEVLLMTDAVDGWAVQALTEFDGVPIRDAAKADEDVAAEASAEKREADDSKTKALRDRMRLRLQDHVSEVRVSRRLTDSPACLVSPEGSLPPHLERLLRVNQPQARKQKRILEINADHPLVTGLVALLDRDASDPRIDRAIDLVHAQALLAEGSPPEDPARLARSFAELLTESITAALGTTAAPADSGA